MSFMKFLPQLNEFILESSWVLQINFMVLTRFLLTLKEI